MMNPRLWFFDNGIRIFPIKYKNKEPACKSWDDYICTRQQAAEFSNYGVALGLFGVADSDTPETEAWNATHLIDTPFKITTGRGRHRCYRMVEDAPHFIHRDNHTIEFRHKGQYVVGPGSTHSSGTVYTADDWSWNINDIPFFPTSEFLWDDRAPELRGSADGTPFILPESIHAGERHDIMFKLMRSLQARGVADVEVLLLVLRAENKEKCHPPIDENELERFIRRVVNHPDKKGFLRIEQDEFTIAGGMMEVGLSLDTVDVLVKAINPDASLDAPDIYFDVDGASTINIVDDDLLEITDEDTPISQPLRPSQPIKTWQVQSSNNSLENPDTKTFTPDTKTPNASLENPDTKSLRIEPSYPTVSKVRHTCQKCAYEWTPKRKTQPSRCPSCYTTLWDRYTKHIGVDDINLVGGNINEEPIDAVDTFIDPNVDEILGATPDGDIYDEETLEVVGTIVNGVITWKDAK